MVDVTENETARILAIIAAAYPRFQVDSEGLTLNVWYEMLGDIDYKVAQLAVQKLILESPYPPAIADVRKRAVEVITPAEDRIDAATAWGEVQRAISIYGYYRPEEALKTMRPRTAQVVKYLNWEEICTCEDLGVIRGQFIKMYDQIAEREEKELLLPAKLKQDMARIGSSIRTLKSLPKAE